MKKCIPLIFYAFLVVQNLFAVELWNGFTDDMTEEQVISRAKSVLSFDADCMEIEEQKYYSDAIRKKIEMFHGDQKYRNDEFMLPDVVIYFSCNDSALDNDTNSRNVAFYFFDNTLYAVYVRWNNTISNEVVQKSKDNYGKNFKEIVDYSPEEKVFFVKLPATKTKWLHWNFEEKENYLRVPDIGKSLLDYPKAELYAISKNHYDAYRAEIARRNNAQKRQAEEEKQRKIDSIQF